VTNLFDKFRPPIPKRRYMYDVSKVTREFAYFLLIFAPIICGVCRI
jgi:hypothetical protein